ncbi:MAG: sigma-70 family RNA polymerase sigma factor [Nannocystaceae bacterium]|nr:sigma-70 family RNA polymerase sigma factor [Nannocystaceae bacterium]
MGDDDTRRGPDGRLDEDRLADLAVVYREHHEYVARVLRYLGLEPHLVDDALQDVFLVVHRRLASFDARRSLRNWLYGIARRVASEYRRGMRRGSRPLVLVSDPSLHAAGRDDVRLESAAMVEQFLTALDEDKRRVFLLTEVEGMTAPEIAEAEQLNVNTVYARLRAARIAFERAVAQHGARDRSEPWTG